MLPQGIFVEKSEYDALSSIHEEWGNDLAAYDSWATLDHGESSYVRTSSQATIIATPSCSSTMEVARDLAVSGELGEWGAVVSAVQTGGRGQLRRPWESLPGNLHASIVLPKLPQAGAWAEGLNDLLPLVAGHLISTVLSEFGATLEIKWPNDLLQFGKKVGGMLIEEQNNTVVLGLGLNLADSPDEARMREDHSALAAKITIPSGPRGPLTLLETLVNRGKNVYAVMLDEIPPSRFLEMIENKLAWMGKPVLVNEGSDTPYEAVITGLSSKGGLVLRRSGKEVILYSGSVFPL